MKHSILFCLFAIVFACVGCSDVEPIDEGNEPANEEEKISLRDEISNIYWIVKDSKFIVDDNEYTPLEAMDMHIMPIGISLLKGLYITDNTFRYYKSSLCMLYNTQELLEENEDTFFFEETASYPEIKILDYTEDCLTIQYLDLIGSEYAVIRAIMYKANNEEIAAFERAVKYSDLFT